MLILRTTAPVAKRTTAPVAIALYNDISSEEVILGRHRIHGVAVSYFKLGEAAMLDVRRKSHTGSPYETGVDLFAHDA